MLETFETQQWDEEFSELNQQRAVRQLEGGHILYFPSLAFALSPEEHSFLSPACANPDSKNIGYHLPSQKLWGIQRLPHSQRQQLRNMIQRYAQCSLQLVQHLLPRYSNELSIARTSFRPVQITGRKTSYRKDDKRLHVDAFPSSPNQGNRILRVFCNVNPHGEDRVWRVGEPFEKVAKKFLPDIRKPFPGTAAALRLLKITKSYRTAYDHYMLHLHDNMKADETYQQKAAQQEIHFPPGATWIVQTDHVSHAAMQGQYLLEQTFYLPVCAMQNPALAPLRILEKILDQKLT